MHHDVSMLVLVVMSLLLSLVHRPMSNCPPYRSDQLSRLKCTPFNPTHRWFGSSGECSSCSLCEHGGETIDVDGGSSLLCGVVYAGVEQRSQSVKLVVSSFISLGTRAFARSRVRSGRTTTGCDMY